MVTPQQAAERIGRLYERKFPEWAVHGAAEPVVDLPLHPPTEHQVLADTRAASAWVAEWRGTERRFSVGGQLIWETRQWASAGTQRLPVRILLNEPEDAAEFIGKKGHWKTAQSRAAELAEVLGRHGDEVLQGQVPHAPSSADSRSKADDVASSAEVGHTGVHGEQEMSPSQVPRAEVPGVSGVHADEELRSSSSRVAVEAVQDVVRRRLKQLAKLPKDEYERLRDALVWLLQNPQSGIYPRQMPIRGVDSKWLEKHAGLVEPLYASATGRASLGLLQPPGLIRLRFLDPALAPGGLGDMSAPAAELNHLGDHLWELREVIVVENLQTLLALPAWDGVVAIHGAGYAAKALADLAWLHQVPVLYWGDLDVDGFQMLSMLRGRLPQVRSVLMDRGTLKEHLDLTVPDRKDAPRSMPEHLSGAERDGFVALADYDGVRLEQERIPWRYALERLTHAQPH